MKISVVIVFSWLLIFGESFAIEPLGTIGNGTLNELSFLPDGRFLRVLETHIEIVDPDSDLVIASFGRNSEPIQRAVASPDGGHLLIKRRGLETVELWDIDKQKKSNQWEYERLRAWSGEVLHYPFVVAFSRTQPLLAMNNGRGQISLWDWETGESKGWLEDERRPLSGCFYRPESTICRHGAPDIYSMAMSPDDRFLVVGSKHRDAEIWSLETRKLVGHLEGHRWVPDVAYSPDGRWIATTELESTKVNLWDAGTREVVRAWRNGDRTATSEGSDVIELQFSRDSQRLYVATSMRSGSSFNDRVRVWDIKTASLIDEFREEAFFLKHVSVSPDESRAILQYADQVAVLWDMKQHRRLRLWANYTGGYSQQLRLSPDGRSLVQVYRSLIKIWDVPSRAVRHVLFDKLEIYREPETLAVSTDSRRFAVGLHWRGIEIRDMETGKLQVHLPDSQGRDALVAFNRKGDRIATSHWGDQLKVVDIDPPHRRQILNTEVGDVIAFSGDDRYLAAADRYNRIHLWEREEQGYAYRYGWISLISTNDWYGGSLVFHPHADPPIVFSSTSYGVVAWQLGTQTAERVFGTESGGPVRFSADGRYVFLNGKEGLQIWNWRTNALVEHPPVPNYRDVSRNGIVLIREGVFQSPQIWDVGALLLPKPVLLGEVKKVELLPNFPNPFNPETWIPYQLGELADVRIRIHDSSGHLVRNLELGTKPAGDYLARSQAAYWDGRNDVGEVVSSGLYFCTLEAGEVRTTRRMNLVK